MAGESCTKCGAPLPPGSAFCTECGASQVLPAAVDVQSPAPEPETVPSPQPYPDPQPAYASPVYDAMPPKGSKYSLCSTGKFFGCLLLFCVPVIGWIFCIVFACGGCRNLNLRNFSKAILILGIISVILFAFLFTGMLIFLKATGLDWNSFFSLVLHSLGIA